MHSLSQIQDFLCQLLGPAADEIAYDTEWMKRFRIVRGSSFVQGLVFGWMHHPDARLVQLCQALGSAGTPITASGLSHRFDDKAVCMMEAVFQRAVAFAVRAEPVEVELLKRFSAVIVEDSTQISLPDELASRWKGCGNGSKEEQAGVKLHVQWDLCSGQIWGPVLTDGSVSDQRSPLREDPELIPEGGVSLCDNGYFGLKWLQEHTQSNRYVLTRPRVNTAFFDRQGRRLDLLELGPTAEGGSLDREVLVGADVRWPGRLLMVRVPEDVAELRRERIRRTAQRHSREADERHLAMAQWTILITNVPQSLLSTAEVVIMQRARWQIERLFRLWKEGGLLDEWRSKKTERIVCEIYGKLIGLLIQHWLLLEICWSDPMRSVVKASRVIRDHAWDVLRVVQGRGSWQELVQDLRRAMGSTCRLDQRGKAPSTAQLLAGGSPKP